MNSRGFPSGLFMLDRLSHLKGGVPAGGGGLLPAWHYINYIVYFSIQCGDPLRFARPPFRRDSPSGSYFTSTFLPPMILIPRYGAESCWPWRL